jgi:hypothetical protein
MHLNTLTMIASSARPQQTPKSSANIQAYAGMYSAMSPRSSCNPLPVASLSLAPFINAVSADDDEDDRPNDCVVSVAEDHANLNHATMTSSVVDCSLVLPLFSVKLGMKDVTDGKVKLFNPPLSSAAAAAAAVNVLILLFVGSTVVDETIVAELLETLVLLMTLGKRGGEDRVVLVCKTSVLAVIVLVTIDTRRDTFIIVPARYTKHYGHAEYSARYK